MEANQFWIFKPNKNFVITPNILIYTLLIISISGGLLTDRYLGDSLIKNVFIVLGVLTIIAAIITAFVNSMSRQILNGEISGILILDFNTIKVDNREILLSQIKNIDFTVGDYVDCPEISINRFDLNPKLSNGVSNFCEIRLIDGEILKFQFQQLYKDEFQKNRRILIQYHKMGKISIAKLNQILNIGNYERIQEFKAEIADFNVEK